MASPRRLRWIVNGILGGAALMALAFALAGCGGGGSRVTSDLLVSGFDGELSSWSPSGTQIATPTNGQIDLYGADGGIASKLSGAGIDYFGWPCECRAGWSADGGEVLFLSRAEEISGDATVGLVQKDGSGLRTRSLGVPVSSSDWGPKGWPLVYVSDSRERRAVGVAAGPEPDLWRLDGLDAKPRRILAAAGRESGPQISPDGREILYLTQEPGQSSLREVGIDGGRPRVLARGLVGPAFAAWSPDGRQIALDTTTRRIHTYHLYLLSAKGGWMHRLVKEGVTSLRPAWRPDGQVIDYATEAGQIRQVDLASGKVSTLGEWPGENVAGLGWSPDGRHLAYLIRNPPTPD
jgi:Tol biopolymer transport system component